MNEAAAGAALASFLFSFNFRRSFHRLFVGYIPRRGKLLVEKDFSRREDTSTDYFARHDITEGPSLIFVDT